MLKLKLDWAAEAPAPLGTSELDELVRVELVSEQGPAGWPEIAVYVSNEPGAPAYMTAIRLQGWLQEVYGADELEAEELADEAEEV